MFAGVAVIGRGFGGFVVAAAAVVAVAVVVDHIGGM